MTSDGLLNHSSNILISQSVINQVVSPKVTAYENLARAAVMSATHESGECFDRPKCHENTRVAVLDRLMCWASGEIDAEPLIMWLYGDAGAGKSAIAQTLAEQLHAQGLLLGSFAFSRNDARRTTHIPLVATVAFQAANTVPGLKDSIVDAVFQDPKIFEKKLEIQLASLLIDPINALKMSSTSARNPTIPHVIIIDGLDECTDHKIQPHILRVIPDAAQKCHIPLKIFIASRPEAEILTAFNSATLKSRSTRLALDASFEPDKDIRSFLESGFQDIKLTHRLKFTLVDPWPKSDVLDQLVQKSSGQFIYASAVVKYVSEARHQPSKRLDIVLGMQPSASERDLPFADLDILYMHILSSIPAENLQMTTMILGLLVIAKGSRHFFFTVADSIRSFLLLQTGELEFYMGDLVSVLQSTPTDSDIFETVRITHASLSDFLLDERRSKQFHISEAAFHAELSRMCLRQLKLGTTANPEAIWYSFETLAPALEKANLTPELQEDLLGLSLMATYQWLLSRNGRQSWAYPFITLATKILTILKTAPDVEVLLSHQLEAFDACMMRLLEKYPACDNLSLIPVLSVVKTEPGWGTTGSFALDSILGPFFQERVIEYTMDCANIWMVARISMPHADVLLDFFRNHSRSREYSLTGARYTAAALLWFNYICEDQFFRDIVEFLEDGRARKKYATLLHALVYLPQLLEKSSVSPDLTASIHAGKFDGKYGILSVNFLKGKTYFGVENFNYRDFIPGVSKAIKDYLKRVELSIKVESPLPGVRPSPAEGAPHLDSGIGANSDNNQADTRREQIKMSDARTRARGFRNIFKKKKILYD